MNCKPGDLAIIVPPSENAGRIVEVVRRAIDGERFTSTDGDSRCFCFDGLGWVVRSDRPLVSRSDFGNIPAWFCEGVALDSILRPISGEPVNDEVTDEVTA